MIALVTGEVGCGKTTVCGRVIELLQKKKMIVGGILAPARLGDGGSKTGIDAVDVATGERRPLAKRVTDGGETIGTYTFDPATLTWAIKRLVAATAGPVLVSTSYVLVVDEIGPLELVRKDGFAAILGSLANPDTVPHALVIVRQAFVDTLTERLDRSDVRQFRVEEHNREHLPAKIAALLGA
jgi:nucleoside-triphosphatase THEP1